MLFRSMVKFASALSCLRPSAAATMTGTGVTSFVSPHNKTSNGKHANCITGTLHVGVQAQVRMIFISSLLNELWVLTKWANN